MYSDEFYYACLCFLCYIFSNKWLFINSNALMNYIHSDAQATQSLASENL